MTDDTIKGLDRCHCEPGREIVAYSVGQQLSIMRQLYGQCDVSIIQGTVWAIMALVSTDETARETFDEAVAFYGKKENAAVDPLELLSAYQQSQDPGVTRQ